MTKPPDPASFQHAPTLRARVEAAEAQVKFADHLLQKLEKRLEAAEAKVEQMQRRLQAAKLRHARLKASFSWRITKPFRRLYRLLRKIGVTQVGNAQEMLFTRHSKRQIDQGASIDQETLVVYEDLMSAIKNRQK